MEIERTKATGVAAAKRWTFRDGLMPDERETSVCIRYPALQEIDAPWRPSTTLTTVVP
jgi:hypothetical protein